MSNIKGKLAVITGISKGIGKCLAEQLLEKGTVVVGWGLNAPDYKHENLHFISCDVTQIEATEAATDKTLEIGNIDFLVNNAGFGVFSPIEKFPADVFHNMLMVNIEGAFNVTRKIAGKMKEKGSGHIINISSIAGRVGAPWGAGYNASKFALTGFSESLFHELRKSGVKVTTVYPGSTKTGFFDDIQGMDKHDNMVDPNDLAATVVHLMDTPPNYLIREVEIRPLNSKKPEA